MKRVRRSGLVSQVAEQLREEIRSGRWSVGTRIPTEPELAELTGTGRNTVREAVQGLVHAGLLERRQGSGTYVVGTSDVGITLARFFATSYSRDVLELRTALDLTAAELAARRRTDDDIAMLRARLDERAAQWEAERWDDAVTADVALHRGIVEASHNAVYLEFYDSLLPTIEDVITQHVAATHRGFHGDHAALVEAVAAGDPVAAVAAARSLFDELWGDL
ncbi:FadR family transcriptional regulator [Rhodococcus rhodnii]|uniref:FadR family transcriptional regulator n=1 Tax=Rhodococcus rhodnii TaxID=38312 RepID=A0A6P2CCX2_9NOCA|nr:FadR family transcriptional regulator [Rhodococcus rhodnii]